MTMFTLSKDLGLLELVQLEVDFGYTFLIPCTVAEQRVCLVDMSEEGLEALNKIIRSRREHGARKNSTLSNFMDCYNHMWDRSRPTIVEMEREIRSKKPKILIATEIEALVESLFLEE